jgi:glycine cleavage system H protein
MQFPEELKYTREHEWARVAGRKVTVGITDHAQGELGDIVFVELPPEGSAVEQGKPFGVVESVKAVSDLYSPVTGKVTGVNGALVDTPEKVNREPYGDGWMIVVETDSDAGEGLLSAAEYEKFVGEEKAK